MYPLNRKSLIQKIHIAKSQLGLDDTTYRQFLAQVAGKSSCSQMTDVELNEVLRQLKAKGFRPVSRQFSQPRPKPAASKEIYLAKITALLMQHQLPQSYADSIAKRAFGVDFVHWLTVEQLQKVVQMLAVYVRRKSER